MNRKTQEPTVTFRNPNVSLSAEKIEEDAEYCNIAVSNVDKVKATEVKDQKFPSQSVPSLGWVTLFWMILLLIMSLRIYFTFVISENTTKMTEENQQLKAENQQLKTENQQLKAQQQQLETQRNNLTEQIKNMVENWKEQNVSRAQWSIDSYCPKGSGGRQCTACQNGWLLSQSSCYAILDAPPPNQRTWEGARENCRGKNSDLAVIVNEAEKSFTIDNSWKEPGINGYWIGLRAENGKWKWIDGSSLTQSSWMSSPPTNNSCVISLQNQPWKSVSCDDKYAWMCEKKALSV